MATIRSQMVLNDGMSAVLKRITSALDTTLNAFEQVQRASGRAVDAAQIAQARSQLVGANAEIQEMADGYRRAAEQEENLNRGLRTGGSLADGMLGKVKTLVATLAAGAGLNKLIGLSDQMTSTTARLSFLVDDGGSVDELEAKIMASAQRSRAAILTRHLLLPAWAQTLEPLSAPMMSSLLLWSRSTANLLLAAHPPRDRRRPCSSSPRQWRQAL